MSYTDISGVPGRKYADIVPKKTELNIEKISKYQRLQGPTLRVRKCYLVHKMN